MPTRGSRGSRTKGPHQCSWCGGGDPPTGPSCTQPAHLVSSINDTAQGKRQQRRLEDHAYDGGQSPASGSHTLDGLFRSVIIVEAARAETKRTPSEGFILCLDRSTGQTSLPGVSLLSKSQALPSWGIRRWPGGAQGVLHPHRRDE